MGRVLATVDVGSNSVTALVAEQTADGWQPRWQEAVITRLGAGLDATGRLSDVALDRTAETLGQCRRRPGSWGRPSWWGWPPPPPGRRRTAPSWCALPPTTGTRLTIIPGEDEAQLSWLAAWRELGAPGRGLTVIDVGGRSTEIIHGAAEAFDFRTSLPLGSVRLTERFVHAEPARGRRPRADRRRPPTPPSPPSPGRTEGARLVAVAGTATTLAAVHLALPTYDADRVHRTELAAADLDDLVDRLFALDLAARRRLPGMEPKRADVLPAGALLLARARRHLGAPALTVSDRGVRWGLLFRLAEE